MGTGYTRNDTANNIADGNVINAADFDGEYDAIEAAFNSSTGHTHDGTAAEGGPITVLGPSQEFVASASAVAPSTNAGLDIGTASLKFKDLYIDGTAYIDGLGGNLLIDTTNALQFRDTALSISSSADGQLDIAADTTAKITSPEVIVTDDFRLQSDAAILTFGADDDVSVTHVADTGLDAQAASGFTLRLQTGDTTVESGNTIGKISFNAPDEASGTDAILVGAEIEAAAEATFSSTDNSTALVFKTNESAAATERMRIKANGDVVIKGASYDVTWDASDNALEFADQAKVKFGNGSDLQIWHDGTNNIIRDGGTTDSYLQTDNAWRFTDVGNNETHMIINDDGAISLYYDNSVKLATTTDGIDVTGDISVGNLNLITNTISSTDTNGDINLSPNGTGTVVINTDLDVDNININGNSITSTNTNGDINITPNGTGKVNIAGGFVPSEINLTSTDAGATAGPVFELHRNSASPADNDAIGAIDFAGQDSGGNKAIYASIDATIMDVTDTTEDGRLDFITQTNGSNYSRMRLDPTETVFNEAGADINFRIEGDVKTNLFVVDASEDKIGINTNSPNALFEVALGAEGEYLRVGGDNSNNGRALRFTSSTNTSNGALHTLDASSSNGAIAFATNSSEAMRIDSNGSVGIGCTPDSTISLDVQNLSASSNNVLLRVKNTTSLEDAGIVIEGNNGGQREYRIGVNTIANSSHLTFSGPTGYRYYLGSTEYMRLDGSGRLGIGQTAMSSMLHVRPQTDTNSQITLEHGSGGNSYGGFVRSFSGTNQGLAYGIYFNGTSTEKMRLDGNGNLLVGKTASNLTNAGIELRSTGEITATRNNNVFDINRTSSDGSIMQFRKDGTVVGNIASRSGLVSTIILDPRSAGNGGTGLTATGSSSPPAILPTDEDGTVQDNYANLGTSGGAFKNLYLSGTADVKEITYDSFNDGAGASGLNVVAYYSFDNNSQNSIGSDFNNRATLLYIVTTNGTTAIPMYPNAGSGVAWQVMVFDPDAGTFQQRSCSFVQGGSSGNTFTVQVASGSGSATIQRTAGSLAYQVYISRISGGTA
jgi:hypothetical protein